MASFCGFFPADILLPAREEDFARWAVIACDQFTSEWEYWERTEQVVGSSPSALRVTLPEIYLSEGEEAVAARVAQVNRTMDEYLSSGVLAEHPGSIVYVEREVSDGKIRHGLVGCIDLADYDYRPGVKARIRATEQTVIERIPPRVRIRRDAPLELPHVMLLADDPGKTVIEPLAAQKESFPLAYDFDLMQGGGHIEGRFLPPEAISAVEEALTALLEAQDPSDRLLFAVGDGNHSLATAKECAASGGPLASRALVEIVNIHDSAIAFEPIYRLLVGGDGEGMLREFCASCGQAREGEPVHRFTFLSRGGEREISVRARAALPVGTLQAFLDGYLARHPEMTIDYIHGEDSMRALCAREDSVGFLFEGMTKEQLFPAVKADGALPRKTFSMGHARDKRYYIEARRIR